jgi:hypothetical protein
MLISELHFLNRDLIMAHLYNEEVYFVNENFTAYVFKIIIINIIFLSSTAFLKTSLPD